MKLLTLLTIPTLALSSVSFGLVGCGKPEPTPPGPTPPGPTPPEPEITETPTEFIDHRTFSLLSYGFFDMMQGSKKLDENLPLGSCLGTGWIIDDATKNDSDDYCYYVGTNWHVTHGIEQTNIRPYLGEKMEQYLEQYGITLTYKASKYYYADKSLAGNDGIIDATTFKTEDGYEPNEYLPLSSYQLESSSNFIYPTGHENYLIPSIDFYVCILDFGNPLGQIKTKLDFLNTYRKTYGYISKFVNANDNSIKNKNKYIGGYPVHEHIVSEEETRQGGKWETHYIENNKLAYYEKQTRSGLIHSIGTPNKNIDGGAIAYGPEEAPYASSFYNYDVSPNYIYENIDLTHTWMSGGASGSMLITQDNEICGIYWGGWGDTRSEDIFHPSFSLFKTTDKNFIQPWE